ncbi:hypothetical protein KP509_1Z234400 [Ceratopteris richardii]|nr:hypothetical protein KP509_1Z234400 [Ceratopteris richardii]
MAIAHLYRQDYAAAQFKMLLTEDVSGRMTALAALQNCSYLMPLGYAAYRCGLTTEWFGVETAAISAMMGVTAALFYHKPSTEGARKLFRASLLYLPVLLAAMVFHRHPNKNAAKSFTATHRRDSTNVNILQDLEKRDQT